MTKLIITKHGTGNSNFVGETITYRNEQDAIESYENFKKYCLEKNIKGVKLHVTDVFGTVVKTYI